MLYPKKLWVDFFNEEYKEYSIESNLIINAILKHKEILPLLIGISPELDKRIEMAMKENNE